MTNKEIISAALKGAGAVNWLNLPRALIYTLMIIAGALMEISKELKRD